MTPTSDRPLPTTIEPTVAFAAQRERFADDATKPLEWRLDQLSRLEQLIVDNQDRLAGALAQDFKTAAFDIAFEIGGALGVVAEAKASLRGWLEPTEAALPEAFAAKGYRARIFHDPYGVALLITPFNAPLILLVAPLVAILSGGNTAVVKPSEVTGTVADALAELFPRYFDQRDVALVRGGREVVSELLTLPFDFIFFTGSVTVGKIVARAAAENLTPVVLELGGQNPSIVDETADIRDAARKLVWGAMAFGGQWCVSPGYVYVHESVADDFVAEAVRAVRDFYGDDPRANADLSAIADPRDVHRLAALIDPARVVVGGETDASARYVAPTVLFPVLRDDAVMQEEIFGPILPVLTYHDIHDVIAAVRSLPAPLSAYLFSRDDQWIAALIDAFPFGGGAVNQTMLQLLFSSLPFGGVGSSGIGQYSGKAGFDATTHAKSVLFSPADESVDIVFPPYDETTATRFAQMMAPSSAG